MYHDDSYDPDFESMPIVICHLCKEEIGKGDSYDLLKSHMYSCDSKEGRAVMKAKNEDCGKDYCNCCQ